MTDSRYYSVASDDESVDDEAEPEFGLLDVVEAFTAMRHEWRDHTKTTLGVAEALDQAVTKIGALEQKLLEQVARGTTDETQQLVGLLTETDNQLTRAIAAACLTETHRAQRATSRDVELQRFFAELNPLARWFARPLLGYVSEQFAADNNASLAPAIEGLNLVLARLRNEMQTRRIQRLDTLGQIFDAETMTAIGSVASSEYDSGHVAEQLSPGYRWRGKLIRFADVRVAE